MKRALVAILILIFSLVSSFTCAKILENKLDSLEEKTENILKNDRSFEELADFWVESESIFAIFLHEEKYRTLERKINLTKYYSGEELQILYHEILYEIKLIRDANEFSVENIL